MHNHSASGDDTPQQPHPQSQNVDSWNRYSHLFEDGDEVITTPEKRQRAPGLIDEAPIPVYPTLAALIGINEAVTLQQIHFLLNSQRTSKNRYNYINGRWWVYNSYQQWRNEHFPWLSESSIKRIFLWHEKNGYLLSMQSVKNKSDRRKWYSIDHAKWNEFLQATIRLKLSDQPSDQNSLMVGLKESDGYSDTSSESTDISVEPNASTPRASQSKSKMVRSVPMSKADQHPELSLEELEAAKRKAIEDSTAQGNREAARQKNFAALEKAVKVLPGVSGKLATQYAHMLNGTATKGVYSEYRIQGGITADEFNSFIIWYRLAYPRQDVPKVVETLYGYLDTWITAGKPVVPVSSNGTHKTALDRAYSDVNGGAE